nr:ribonuclease H-like domain-containing protein [Tanacetum cinerariifolium]
MSANDKFGLGYGDYRYGSILSYENDVLQNVFMNKASDLEDTPVNDRFADGMHATSADESDSKSSEYASCESDSNVETSTSMPEPVENASNVICEPKVWTDTPISEEENIKETDIANHIPKIEKQDRNGPTRKGLGYAFTIKACFVCGSFSHLIRDCDFHEKTMAKQAELTKSKNKADPHGALKDKGIIDSGCFRHMTGNKAYFADYQEFKGGSVAFGSSNRRITGKGNIKTGRLYFEDVYYVENLKHYNLFSVSQMCNKKNKVLFTDTDCLVLYPDFKLPDENQVLLKIPRQHNMYSFNLKNIDPSRDLACLFGKALIDESNKCNRRLGHVNFKNLNKLVKGNIVRGLPSKIFKNDHTCVACQKEKQHKASCKAKTVISVTQPLQILHMDLFGLTSVRSINHKTYCLVILMVLASLVRVLVTKPQNKTPYELLTEEIDLNEEHFILAIWSAYPTTVKSSGDKIEKNTGFKTCEKPVRQVEQVFLEEFEKLKRQEKEANDAAESLRMEATHDIQNASTSNLPFGKKAIGTKWVYWNKKDKRGVVVRNKARLVAQGHRQEEGIDYDEVFAHVARIEAIRIFLAFASYMGFIVYQKGMKSAFLYGIIDEEEYVSQPPGFVDLKFPNKVYKVIKALYGLHQAPRAWYATLSTFFEKSGYRRGAIDKTLFIKKDKKD